MESVCWRQDTPAELYGADMDVTDFETCFIALLTQGRKRRGHDGVTIIYAAAGPIRIAIDARGLTRRFAASTAVDHVLFR